MCGLFQGCILNGAAVWNGRVIVAAQGGILNDVANRNGRVTHRGGCETELGSLGVFSKTLDCCTLRLFENIGSLHFTRLGRDLTHEQVIKKLNTVASISHHSIQRCSDPTSTSHQRCSISFHTCVFRTTHHPIICGPLYLRRELFRRCNLSELQDPVRRHGWFDDQVKVVLASLFNPDDSPSGFGMRPRGDARSQTIAAQLGRPLSGEQRVSDLASVGGEKHAHKNLLRKLLKKSRWPRVYHTSVRCGTGGRTKSATHPFPWYCLTSSCMSFASTQSPRPIYWITAGWRRLRKNISGAHRHSLALRETCSGWLAGLTGVACKWDRSESQDMLIMSLPGVRGRWRDLCIPLCTLPHCWVTKHNTFDDILSVMTWSLRQAARGTFPTCRHDGTPWTAEDVYRKRLRTRIGCAALLCQITVDWKMYKDIFRFSQHNEKKGCCFKCEVTPDGIRNTGSSAPWRHQRLDHWGLLLRLRQHGLQVSPLF